MFQTIEYLGMMSMEASTNIMILMTPGAGVPVLGRGQFCHIVKMHFSTPGHLADKLRAYMQLN